MSILIMTSGSVGSEFSVAYIEVRIPFWIVRPEQSLKECFGQGKRVSPPFWTDSNRFQIVDRPSVWLFSSAG